MLANTSRVDSKKNGSNGSRIRWFLGGRMPCMEEKPLLMDDMDQQEIRQ